MEENLFKIDLFHSASSNARRNWIYVQMLGWYRCVHEDPEYYNEGLPGYELIYTRKGEGWTEINNRRWSIPEKSIALIPTQQRFGVGPAKDSTWEFLYVHFDWNGFKELYNSLTHELQVFTPKVPEVMEEEFWSIYRMKKKEEAHFDFLAFHRLLNILASLHNSMQPADTAFDTRSREHHEVQQITEYIRNHYHQAIYVKDLAQMVGYSEDYLSKLFKRETGYTITEFNMKCRFEVAKTLLLNSTYTMKEISVKTGFENPAYFSRIFKEKVGVTPAEFRRKRPF